LAKIIDEEYWDNLKEPTKLTTFLSRLLTTPQTSTVLIAIGLCLAAFFWVYFLVTLTTEDNLRLFSVYGQFNFEYGWIAQTVDVILADWGSAGCARVFYATLANFVIIASYNIIFIGLIVLAARLLQKNTKIQNLCLKMIFLPIIAGIFNVIGNIAMLIMLVSGTSVSPIFPFIASLCGIAKNGLIIASLIVVIIEMILFIVFKLKEYK